MMRDDKEMVQMTTRMRDNGKRLQTTTNDKERTSMIFFILLANTEYIYKMKSLRNKRGEINDIIKERGKRNQMTLWWIERRTLRNNISVWTVWYTAIWNIVRSEAWHQRFWFCFHNVYCATQRKSANRDLLLQHRYMLEFSACSYDKYLVRYEFVKNFKHFVSHSCHFQLQRWTRSSTPLPYISLSSAMYRNSKCHEKWGVTVASSICQRNRGGTLKHVLPQHQHSTFSLTGTLWDMSYTYYHCLACRCFAWRAVGWSSSHHISHHEARLVTYDLWLLITWWSSFFHRTTSKPVATLFSPNHQLALGPSAWFD